MFEAIVNTKSVDRMPEVKKIFEELEKMDVLVGVPEETGDRESGSVTNAQLVFIHTHGARKSSVIREMAQNVQTHGYKLAHQMYIQSHGSAIFRIPPRPIIEPAIEDSANKEAIAKQLGNAAKSAMDGNKEEAVKNMEKAGMQAQNRVRAWFDNPANGWSGNAESTVKAKGSDRPLIDTGELRKSITFVVRDKND